MRPTNAFCAFALLRSCRYVEHLIGILEKFCPGISDCIAEAAALTPPKVTHACIQYSISI